MILKYLQKKYLFLVSLKDDYGDHGLVALVCAKDIKKNFLYVENFLMSCRILGRYLEYSIVNELAKICKKEKLANNFSIYFNKKINQSKIL